MYLGDTLTLFNPDVINMISEVNKEYRKVLDAIADSIIGNFIKNKENKLLGFFKSFYPDHYEHEQCKTAYGRMEKKFRREMGDESTDKEDERGNKEKEVVVVKDQDIVEDEEQVEDVEEDYYLDQLREMKGKEDETKTTMSRGARDQSVGWNLENQENTINVGASKK